MKTNTPRKLHWWRGEQDGKNTACGKEANRTQWTSSEAVWAAPENTDRRCSDCLKNK